MSDIIHHLKAEEADPRARLDKFLTARLPDLSRSRLQGLIAQGMLTSEGAAVDDAAAKVRSGQLFELRIPDAVPSHIQPSDIALDIIYEDGDLLVINKQAGLTVHPAPGHQDDTLVNALLAYCGSSLSGIGGVARPGIVHRIDKDTTGLLVVAKHDAAHNALSEQLAARTLSRVYTAIAWGAPKPAAGSITGNIGRSLANRQKMAVLRVGGKAAATHYKTLAAYSPGDSKTPPASLLECRLETGRTHQIRVHMAFIGHPLVGDQTYGQSTASRLNTNHAKSLPEATREALLAFDRQALHARELELIHPRTGKAMRFEAPLPKDMQALIAALD